MKSHSIAIDARMVNASGIGTYLQGLLLGLSKKDLTGYALTLFGNPPDLPQGPWNVRKVSAPIYSIREQLLIPSATIRQGCELFHAPHYNISWMIRSRTVVTVHDVIHLKFPQYWPSPVARAYAHIFFTHIIPKARAILTVSENTKRDLIEILGIPADRITVTYPAVDHARFQNIDPSLQSEFNQLGLSRDYLLYIGNLKEFKNVERLVDAYCLIRSKDKNIPELVMVGRNFIKGFEKRLENTPGIRWIGEVRRDLLPAFYKNALLFIFPSLYEGFGLPPLEAMASGTPVLCSSRASLPEVVGNAAVMIDPENTEALAAAMSALMHDPQKRKDLSAKGLQQAAQFSWDRMADQTLQVYQRCLS